jgi:thioredoxin-related protein
VSRWLEAPIAPAERCPGNVCKKEFAAMTVAHKTALCLVALCVLLGYRPCPAGSSANRVRWFSYEEGMALGQQESKKVFLNFYQDPCVYCDKMTHETFEDAAVAAYLNRHYIPVQIDYKKRPDLVAEYYVPGTPTSCFVSETGETITSLPGYYPPQELLPLLRYIQTDSYKSMSYQNFRKEQ